MDPELVKHAEEVFSSFKDADQRVALMSMYLTYGESIVVLQQRIHVAHTLSFIAFSTAILALCL